MIGESCRNGSVRDGTEGWRMAGDSRREEGGGGCGSDEGGGQDGGGGGRKRKW